MAFFFAQHIPDMTKTTMLPSHRHSAPHTRRIQLCLLLAAAFLCAHSPTINCFRHRSSTLQSGSAATVAAEGSGTAEPDIAQQAATSVKPRPPDGPAPSRESPRRSSSHVAPTVCSMYDCEAQRVSGSNFCANHTPCSGALGTNTGGTFPELFPMYLLEADGLIALGEIPRFDDPRIDAFRKKYTEIQPYRKDSFVFFLSHRWLSPQYHDPAAQPANLELAVSSGHPDKPSDGHPKYKLLVACLEKLKKGQVKDKQIFVWIDFSCLPQTTAGSEIRLGIESLPSYIRCRILP